MNYSTNIYLNENAFSVRLPTIFEVKRTICAVNVYILENAKNYK